MYLSPQNSVLLVTVLIYSLVPFTSAGIGLKIPYLSFLPGSRVPPGNQANAPPQKLPRQNPLHQQQHLPQLPKMHPLLQHLMKLLPTQKQPSLYNPNPQHLKQQNIRPHQPIRRPQPQQHLSTLIQHKPEPHQQQHLSSTTPLQQFRHPQQLPQTSQQQQVPAQSVLSLQHHFQQSDSSEEQHHNGNGALYLHDPDSSVNFYFKENLYGPSKRVDVHHDGCRDVPKDYWHHTPKSLWAKHCIVLYQNGHCEGDGVQVAGAVHELRTAGFHYGVASFRPCEKNIRVRFTSPQDNKLHHNHHHHNHRRY